MRISGGFARGYNLKVPRISDIRPTQEVVRQAVFSMLGERITGASVLDLYAGSGSYGLEALSRGATHATFVDNNIESIKAIKANLEHARFWGKAEVAQRDVMRYLSHGDSQATFDLIFVDPPYEYGIPTGLLYHLAHELKPNGLIIFDHAQSLHFNEQKLGELQILDSRSYGASGITFLALSSTNEEYSSTENQADSAAVSDSNQDHPI